MYKDSIAYSIGILLIIVVISFVVLASPDAQADVQAEIDKRNAQIAEIEQQIAEYEKQIAVNQSKAKTLSTEINRLNATINKVQLEIQSLNLAIENTDNDILTTEEAIFKAQNDIAAHKESLAESLQAMYEIDQKSLTHILLANNHLSDFFVNVNNVTQTQDTLRLNIATIKQAKIDLEEQEESLRGKRSELASLRSIQASQKSTLDTNKAAKDKILSDTKGEEQRYQELKQQGQRDINAIRAQITSLLQSGLTVDDVITQAELAATRAGIRPAFLIALLEVETNLGQNLGSGNWEDDMYLCYIRLGTIYYPHREAYYRKRAEDEKAAFFQIINELGLDPNTVKVSKEPRYGCGGAVGPAQFIPTTWLGYKDRVAAATGHYPPNPWNVEDAFTAAAIKLAAGGATAQTRDAESGAARAYVGGRTTCSSSICNYYSNLVLEKAAIIESNLGN